MQIISANSGHLTELLKLSNNAFGDGFVSQHDINEFITSENKHILVAIENNKVAGLITAITCTADKLNQKILSPTNEIEVSDNDAIGIIKQVAVNANHYRKGVADLLLKHSLTEITIPTIWFCVSWYKGEITPMSKLLLKNNFKLVKIIPNYWSDESIIKQYHCAVCGTPPCTCKAELFSLNKKRS